ncbi:MAG TPA: ATP-dependent DNA helicase RecG [Patescibacteria group bacterium]|jgi:ATP-dependent DNA helicase RecG|nr:ATP-dependent DNA helicase RecG [Patescibacteria group bacterium]
MLSLDTPISVISGVGEAMVDKLAKLGIKTIGQAVYYYPFRYDDFTHRTTINRVVAGETVNVVGTIDVINTRRSPRQHMYVTEAIITDDTGKLRVTWFNQPFLSRNLQTGDYISLAGKVSQDLLGPLMISPQYEKVDRRGITQHTSGLVPVYSTISGLTTKQLRAIIGRTLNLAKIDEWLPSELLKKRGLLSLREALINIHRPPSWTSLEAARHRLAFDELVILQLRGQLIRERWQTSQAPIIRFNEALTKEIVNSWSFQLTDDQRRCSWQILQDLEQNQPMLRLLQGDVGSGKTAVAILAMANVADSGYQTALIAPSEVLAYQHFQTVVASLGEFFVIGLLTRTQQFLSKPKEGIKKTTKKQLVRLLSLGQCQVVIGTQALLQEPVDFYKLGLLIVDEQHRFGVEQRQLLLNKKLFAENGQNLVAHFLAMTATPIPRSLALSLYGDLNLSVIRTMPAGRLPVITKIVEDKDRAKMYKFIRQLLDKGEQAFIVCPLVDPSDKLAVKAATDEFNYLVNGELKGYKVGLLHGRLSGANKQKVMADFAAGRYQVLVATAVVELGLDIPQATVMVIEGADRFGLAQLHQYRGRVGRRGQQAYCFLLPSPASGELAKRRLKAVVKYNNGQELARLDLKWRGPGELYGYEQTGFSELRLANIFDQDLISAAHEIALEVLHHPNWRYRAITNLAWQLGGLDVLPQ